MKIVVGAPVKDRAWILPSWFESVESQGIDLEVVMLYSDSDDETEQILKDHKARILYHPEEGRPTNQIDAHMWGRMSDYAYMAKIRNELLQYVEVSGADYFLSLDSDITLPPNGLRDLLAYAEAYHGVVSPAVNMVTGQQAQWNTMQWSKSWKAERLQGHPVAGKADVVMAAMLLDRGAMECRWAEHEGGEDIGFCRDAEQRGIPRWWVPQIRCNHFMRRLA